jgi:hypothetical protein
MTDSPQTPAVSSPLSLPEQTPGWGAKLLRGDSWWAVILRSVLYILTVASITILAAVLVSVLIPTFDSLGADVARLSARFINEATLALGVLLAALLMSFLEKQKMDDYGLPLGEAFSDRFWQGILAGLIAVTALVGMIAAAGGYSFGRLLFHQKEAIRLACYWALFMCLVAIFEEFLFRGYLQRTLGKRFGFWPSAFVLSGLFGCVHLTNIGEDWVGAASVALVGLVLCLSLERTGNLWFAVGLHASFNFGQTFLFSVPDSGNVFADNLSSARLRGPVWLTGGSVGPEASLFCFLTMGLLAYAIHRIYPKKTEPAPPA